jgi:hypothetical protein
MLMGLRLTSVYVRACVYWRARATRGPRLRDAVQVSDYLRKIRHIQKLPSVQRNILTSELITKLVPHATTDA